MRLPRLSEGCVIYLTRLSRYGNSLHSRLKIKILSNHEIRIAAQLLVKHIPKSLKVYGFLFALNRTEGSRPPTVISVDAWPELNVIVSRTQTENKRDPKERVLFFSKDEQILSTILKEHDVVDWTASLSFADSRSNLRTTQVTVNVNVRLSFSYRNRQHLFSTVERHILSKRQQLQEPMPCACITFDRTEHSEDHFKISSLNDSNVELVNKTWKFGGHEDVGRHIKKMIGNFPSCCIIDEYGQPVSWIILDDFCTMGGMLHTLPAHRGKGYAKALVSCMARKLHAQGFPVYCFVEEENAVSYKLFTNLGFVEDPSYRAAWWDCNF
ncbi:LOW QUALITY PROTEIN: glycine N-acyltransferase-like protein 3 [Gadus macrocephalus]|uniref:LOW QUALITY PROTEIN: glycine N-acyltransferase-like protein 3 n=1 Tax=Gadus macrocephalus TaxID=80720 RepID=UPI0028CB493F|nr:LOW QUALITY PROTEIN: glycine N-acyltransferase-like protein 3 [Gadus macrocephalus]